MTPIELHRLAGAVATLRPDWPAASLQTFLERNLAHRPLRDAAIALIACALDPATSTPARVLEPGPWWQAARTRDVPTARNTCPDHPLHAIRLDQVTGETTCGGCWADRHADTSSHATFHRPEPPAAELAAIRGDIHHAHPTAPRERRKPADVEALAAVRRELEQARAAAADATPPPDVSRADDAANPDVVQRPA